MSSKSRAKDRPGGEIGDPQEWQPERHQAEDPSFVPTDQGLLLPAPTHKPVRYLYFEGGLAITVSESQEEVRKIIDTGRLGGTHWLGFHDPVFGTLISVPITALEDLLWVSEGWRDMAAEKATLQQRELALKAQRSGMQLASAPTANGRPRR